MKSNLAYKKLWDVTEFAAMRKLAIFNIRFKPSISTLDGNKYIGEIPNKLKLLVSQFAGLPQEKIVKIFANKFRPIYLYKLYHIKECNNLYWDKI